MCGLQKSFVAVAVSAIAIVSIAAAGLAVLYFAHVSHVMTKTSPDGRHTAKLHRVQGIDVIFQVKVNGSKVYTSPDFAPADADFREQIAWNADGNIVVLEVGGERFFGFHAAEKRSLTDEDLLLVEFTPFDALGYEGSLPIATSPE